MERIKLRRIPRFCPNAGQPTKVCCEWNVTVKEVLDFLYQELGYEYEITKAEKCSICGRIDYYFKKL